MQQLAWRPYQTDRSSHRSNRTPAGLAVLPQSCFCTTSYPFCCACSQGVAQ